MRIFLLTIVFLGMVADESLASRSIAGYPVSVRSYQFAPITGSKAIGAHGQLAAAFKFINLSSKPQKLKVYIRNLSYHSTLNTNAGLVLKAFSEQNAGVGNAYSWYKWGAVDPKEITSGIIEIPGSDLSTNTYASAEYAFQVLCDWGNNPSCIEQQQTVCKPIAAVIPVDIGGAAFSAGFDSKVVVEEDKGAIIGTMRVSAGICMAGSQNSETFNVPMNGGRPF